jgi:predicted nucleic acid-binding Zn ribbon protein
MQENGIRRQCFVCGKSFFCTDGDYVCSSKCDDKLEENQEQYDIEEE